MLESLLDQLLRGCCLSGMDTNHCPSLRMCYCFWLQYCLSSNSSMKPPFFVKEFVCFEGSLAFLFANFL
jgi:hypothetical protein